MCQKDVAIGRGNVFFPQTTQWLLFFLFKPITHNFQKNVIK